MVFKFRLISNEDKDFIRDIELLSDQTFYDFHKVLVRDFHYDNSQIASFFTTTQAWEKQKEFTLFDMSDDGAPDSLRMDKAILKDFIKDEHQRLLYVFDFFNERSLFIEHIDIGKKLDYVDYPRITFSHGHPPVQILMDNNFEGFNSDE